MSKRGGSELTGAALLRYWEDSYPDCPPVGYLLRQRFAEFWYRIHTLPESKRYADSSPEMSEILRRHNILLTSLLGDGKRYVLITTGYSDSTEPVQSYQQLQSIPGSGEHWMTTPMHILDNYLHLNYWHFFFYEMTWTGQSMDELLKLVADDVISNVLFLNMDQQRLYHPYDGGADIFVNSTPLRNELKQHHKAWLSNHPDGL